MAQEPNASLKELALARFEFETSFCQFPKDSPQMGNTFLGHPGKENDVIQVKDTPVEMQISETDLHEVLKCGGRIHNAKWHSHPCTDSQESNGKGSEWFTSFIQLNMPVPTFGI